LKCDVGFVLDGYNSCGVKNSVAGVVAGVLVPFFVVVFLVIAIVVVAFVVLSRRRKKIIKEETGVFKLRNTNIRFLPITVNSPICVNKNEIKFDLEGEELIPMNKETRDLLCVGNRGRVNLKVQISSNENSKYEFHAKPSVMFLKPGEGCEFEVFIFPLCTCTINDKLALISLDISKAQETIYDLKIHCVTQFSTLIDPDEISQGSKIGEGSFGVVYKCVFRNIVVAVKKLKNLSTAMNTEIEQFQSEIETLAKIHCLYIIRFYGSIQTKTTLAMVTEFIEHGSFEDLMARNRERSLRIRRIRLGIKSFWISALSLI